jgi:glycosyltransferase involved in cell wall biosynthesis
MDLVADADRYALLAVSMTRGESFDVVHAHDWLTFPAGIMLSTISRKPLVVHIHSTEYDRAGTNANRRIVEVERMGMAAASKVFTVSQLTKSMIVRRYGIAPNKIDVVYNAIDAHEPSAPPAQLPEKSADTDRIVLFLGRITWQKGPEYFVNAAKRVLEVAPKTKFVLAGSGDMSLRMIDLANKLGIGNRVFFTGFLNEADVNKVFALADVFVMPSVSEPFGIAALEALSHQVPVIISRTSGAGEVLEHVLKVDFWDVDDLANKIAAVLNYPPLAHTLRENSEHEVRRLSWGAAATRCVQGYESVVANR